MTRTSRPAWMAKARSTPGKLRGDLLEIGEALDVRLQHLAPRARALARQHVGGVDQVVEHVGGRHLAVVGVDRLDHARGLAVLARGGGADDGVRALGLLLDRLADVVQEARAPRGLDRQVELGRHRAGQEADLDRMLQQVLRVARAELELADQAGQLRVQPRQPEIEGRLLARLLALLLDLARWPSRPSPRCAWGGCGRRR